MPVQGTVANGFENVREAFAKAQEDDPGEAQLAVYHRGELVVDLWTNDARDSLSILMSVTKGLTATCAHLLVERGRLDVDTPVVEYWPEFGANGKDTITVRHLLAHTAGLFTFPPDAGIGLADLGDWDRCVAVLAAMAPFWRPGTAYAYHAATFGYLVGEVVRRVTGRSVGQFFADEFARPLGLDLWIGLPEDEEPRVVDQFSALPPNPPAAADNLDVDLDSPMVQAQRAANGDFAALLAYLNSRAGHAAEIPAANGIGTARSVARFYASLIGEVEGVRLLAESTVDEATVPQTNGLSLPGPLATFPDPYPLALFLGYEQPRPGVPMLGPASFGHSGAGGRLGYADTERTAAVGYVCTNMLWDPTKGPDPRWSPWTAALREALSAPND